MRILKRSPVERRNIGGADRPRHAEVVDIAFVEGGGVNGYTPTSCTRYPQIAHCSAPVATESMARTPDFEPKAPKKGRSRVARREFRFRPGCANCGDALGMRRMSADYCSEACRKRAERRRWRQRQNNGGTDGK